MKYLFVSFYFNKQQSDLNRENYIDMMNGNEENCINKIEEVSYSVDFNPISSVIKNGTEVFTA